MFVDQTTENDTTDDTERIITANEVAKEDASYRHALQQEFRS